VRNGIINQLSDRKEILFMSHEVVSL